MGPDWDTRFTDDQAGAEKTYDYTHSYVLKGSEADLNAKQFNNQYDIDKKEKGKYDTYPPPPASPASRLLHHELDPSRSRGRGIRHAVAVSREVEVLSKQ